MITVENVPQAESFQSPERQMCAVYLIKVGTSQRYKFRLDGNGRVSYWHWSQGWLTVGFYDNPGMIDSSTGPEIVRAAFDMIH